MSDRAATLACFGYFLCHSRPWLTKTNQAKVVESDLVIGFIEVISTGVAFI